MKVITLIWNSPTATTWASFAAKGLNLVVILPLVLHKFSTAEIALWYLFLVIMSFQLIADFGFGPTFIRVLSFAMGGVKDIKDMRGLTLINMQSEPNREHISKIVSTMASIYIKLTIAVFILLVTFGTWSLIKPISFVDNELQAWISWVIIVLSTCVSFFGGVFSNYLQGINKIAVYRRWDAVTTIGAIISSFIVVFMYSNLLLLVIVNQIWIVINVIRNIWLCRLYDNSYSFKQFKIRNYKMIFDSVFPPAWKSGLGMIMSYGFIQSSGIIFAQFGEVAQVASYLLSLRILQAIISFSQAPFYSKIPLLAQLMAQGNMNRLVMLAKRGMTLSYWVYVIGVVLAGLIVSPLLTFIKSNADFVSPTLWSLMALAFFIERYGAMHIQLYSTTNHIIWHIANGVSGLIYIVISLTMFPFIDVYAFPLGILIGYIGFYSWYAALHSYRTFGLGFVSYEKYISLPPLVIILIYTFYRCFF